MNKIFLVVAIFVTVFGATGKIFAQRKTVGAKEVNGTFQTNDGANEIKIWSVGRGGLDNPGNNLQVEFNVSLKLGRDGDARGNTGQLSGYAQIVGDTATFTPAGMEYERCTVTLKFAKPNRLVVSQKGDCEFITDSLTTAGSYRKKSGSKPKFAE